MYVGKKIRSFYDSIVYIKQLNRRQHQFAYSNIIKLLPFALHMRQYLTLEARKNSPVSKMMASTWIKGSAFILVICYFHTCYSLKCYAGDKVGFEDVSSKDCDKACKNVTKRM